MASSCKVHTLGLPHCNPQFLLAHCVPQLLYPFTLTCGNLGAPSVGHGQARALFMSLHLDNILGSRCSRLGMTMLGQAQGARGCSRFLSCGKVCDIINPFPSRLCLSQTLCPYLQASSWYLEGSLKCLFPLPATKIIVSVSTQEFSLKYEVDW